jgi:hypothetical protein
MNRSVEIRVSISTDPRRDGRYFIDVRDTTDGRNRQMTTVVDDLEGALSFISKADDECKRQGITLTLIDNTQEM